MMDRLRSKFFIALYLMILLIAIGIFGYHFMSGFTWVDSIYMTIITATTVGFGEVQPLDDTGKIFTVLLIIFSIIIYGYGISIVTEYLLSNRIFENLIRKRMEKKVNKFNNHIILVGYGRNGKQALKKLNSYDKQVVVIESEELKEEVPNTKNIVYCNDDATKDNVLIRAGIERASALISTLAADTNNLFIVLSARQLNPNIEIICRASDADIAKKLKLAGADKIILPHKIGGEYMASLLVTPDLVEFMQQLTLEDRDRRTNLEEISFDDCPLEYHNQSISELNLRKKTGCTIIGFKSKDGEYIINPDPATKMVKGSNLIILGQPEQIRKLNKLFGIK